MPNLSCDGGHVRSLSGSPDAERTPGNERLLGFYSDAGEALGYGQLTASDPTVAAPATSVSVAPYIDGIEGLGAMGGGSHSPSESVNLPALTMQTERAAVMMYRLLKERAESFRRKPSM